MHNILIVEDDVNINNMILEALSKNELACTQAFSGSEASLCVKNRAFMPTQSKPLLHHYNRGFTKKGRLSS